MKDFLFSCLLTFRDEGFLFIRGLLVVFILDALLIDDEPLGEPIEGSMIQTGLFFIFLFAGIGENLINSRFGSYVGRDKRVGVAGYKSFQLIELGYLISYGAASLFVIVPFYYEITYQVAFIVSGGDGFSRIFIFKFLFYIYITILLSSGVLLNLRGKSFQILFMTLVLITAILCYLLFGQVYTSLFAYFTDPIGYQKTKFNDMIQLSQEPNKWGGGSSKRDHFTYHRVSTVFGMKNDGPFAGAFLMINLFFVLTLFFNLLFGLTLIRKSYSLGEIHYTLLVFSASTLKQIAFFFLLIFILVFTSFLLSYGRFPIEMLGIINEPSGFLHLLDIMKNYLNF